MPQQTPTSAQILTLFRQRPLFGVGFLLFIGVCIGVLVWFFRPTPATQPPSVSTILGRPTQLQDISFAGAIPNIPSSLKVYEGGSSPIIPSSYAQTLAEHLGMTPLEQPGPKNVWIDSALGASLQLLPNNTFLYSAKRNADNTFPPLTAAQLAKVAESFVASELFFDSNEDFSAQNFSVVLDKISFFSGSAEGEETPQNLADTYRVPLTLTLESYPVFFEEDSNTLFEIWLDRSETVIKATFPPPIPSPVELQNAPTLSSGQIIESIQNGLVETLHLYGSEDAITIDELLSYSITQLEIEYRYIPETNVFFPYFFLTGEAKTKDGRIGDLGLLVPAVSTTPPEAPSQ